MGYETEYQTDLTFTRDLTIREYSTIIQWSKEEDVDWMITSDMTIEWDGAEKSYDLIEQLHDLNMRLEVNFAKPVRIVGEVVQLDEFHTTKRVEFE